MLSEKELQFAKELEATAQGELRYWPTHYMGTTPYIFAVADDGRETQLFIARNREGKTANTELHPYEGDRAIACAKRMTMAANALPHLLKRIEELEAALAPFAALAEKQLKQYHSQEYDGRGWYISNGEVVVSIGDLRRAIAALRKEEQA